MVTEKILLKKGEQGYREYRIPGILPLAGGAVLLCCEARMEQGDWGDIDVMVLRMAPDGSLKMVLQMGESRLPWDGSLRTYNNPVLIPDGQRVHLIYHKNYERAFLCTSEDGGESWSDPREITAAYREADYAWNVCATGPGHGMQMKNGRLIAPIWLAHGELEMDGQRRKHWPSVCGCIYSDDHGATWHAGHLAREMKDGNETAAAPLPSGKVLFNYRNREESHCRWLGISENGEALESCWQEDTLADPMCFGGMAATEQGVIFGNCDSREKRVNVTVKYTRDGKEWKKIWEVDEKGGYVDVAYAEGKIYAFYERVSYESRMVDELVLKISDFAEAE